MISFVPKRSSSDATTKSLSSVSVTPTLTILWPPKNDGLTLPGSVTTVLVLNYLEGRFEAFAAVVFRFTDFTATRNLHQ